MFEPRSCNASTIKILLMIMTTVVTGFSTLAFLSNSGIISKSFQITSNVFHNLSPPFDQLPITHTHTHTHTHTGTIGLLVVSGIKQRFVTKLFWTRRLWRSLHLKVRPAIQSQKYLMLPCPDVVVII